MICVQKKKLIYIFTLYLFVLFSLYIFLLYIIKVYKIYILYIYINIKYQKIIFFFFFFKQTPRESEGRGPLYAVVHGFAESQV